MAREKGGCAIFAFALLLLPAPNAVCDSRCSMQTAVPRWAFPSDPSVLPGDGAVTGRLGELSRHVVAREYEREGGGLRLRGGRVKTLADRLYAKKRKAADEDIAYQKMLKEEEEEIADEYRGLPYEERLQLAVGDGIVNRTRGNAPNHGKSGQDADRSHEGADAMGEGQGPPCEQGAHPSRESGTEGGQHASEGVAPGTISGQVKTFSDVHVLRTGRCSGDAWAGLFFDVQSECDESLEILGIATASHIFRKEEAVSVQVFACDGSAVGREGDLAAWDSVFFGCNISLPKVGKRDDASMYNESLSAYGCMSLAKPLRVKAGQTVGLAIYTNSLSGLALRYHAPLPLESATESEPMEDRDHLGRRIGRAAVRIVADAQDHRRAMVREIKIGEVSDSDENLRIRAGYCTPITGTDHPFSEELIERYPDNVRAFVGEIVYQVAHS